MIKKIALAVAALCLMMGTANAGGYDYSYLWNEMYVAKSPWHDNKAAITGAKADIMVNKAAISHNAGKINAISKKHESDMRSINKRLDDVEGTKFKAHLNLRLHDSKRVTTSVYTDFDLGTQRFDAVGIRFDVKLGTSYEERQMEILNERLKRLENIEKRRNLNK